MLIIVYESKLSKRVKTCNALELLFLEQASPCYIYFTHNSQPVVWLTIMSIPLRYLNEENVLEAIMILTYSGDGLYGEHKTVSRR